MRDHQPYRIMTADKDTNLTLIEENSKDMVLKIKPMTEESARAWLGAANDYGDAEIIEHFAECVRDVSAE